MNDLNNLLEQLFELGEISKNATAEKVLAGIPTRKAALLGAITVEVERLISAGPPLPQILDGLNSFLRGAGEVS